VKSEKKILIIDDVESNIISLVHILKPSYRLYTAENGEKGLEYAKKYKPDLILLDIILPEMSGYDVIKELKENEKTKNIPVLFLSGLNDVENIGKGMVLGAVDFITKPFDVNQVKTKVEARLNLI